MSRLMRDVCFTDTPIIMSLDTPVVYIILNFLQFSEPKENQRNSEGFIVSERISSWQDESDAETERKPQTNGDGRHEITTRTTAAATTIRIMR